MLCVWGRNKFTVQKENLSKRFNAFSFALGKDYFETLEDNSKKKIKEKFLTSAEQGFSLIFLSVHL